VSGAEVVWETDGRVCDVKRVADIFELPDIKVEYLGEFSMYLIRRKHF